MCVSLCVPLCVCVGGWVGGWLGWVGGGDLREVLVRPPSRRVRASYINCVGPCCGTEQLENWKSVWEIAIGPKSWLRG